MGVGGRKTVPGMRSAPGMSLVEILVAMVILAVGMFAIVRVLIPGLAIMPSQGTRLAASQLASQMIETLRTQPELRPDAVCHAIAIDASDLTQGYALVHDVSMTDVYQFSHLASQAAGARSLVFPTLVVGERFRVPVANAASVAHLARYGPVRPESAWVYHPTPVPMVGTLNDLWSTQGPFRYVVTDWATGTIAFPQSPEVAVSNFRACYTYLDSGSLVDVIGQAFTAAPGTDGTLQWSAGRDMVPNSLTVYREVGGAIIDQNVSASDRSLGIVRLTSQEAEVGSLLAMTYEIQSHRRTGFENSITDPREPDSLIMDFDIPDILYVDALIPATDTRTVKLPTGFVVSDEGLVDGAGYTHIPEPVIAVSKADGQVFTPGSGITDVDYVGGSIEFDSSLPPLPIPVRIYYRAQGGWARELHLAPESFARMASASGRLYIDPVAGPTGIKQFWYFNDETILGSPAVLQFFSVNATDPAPDTEGGMQDAGGHTIAVDYAYADETGAIRWVYGETHVIGVGSHKVELKHEFDPTDPRQGIRAVRGISCKARTCWEENGARKCADVDGFAIRS